MPSRAFEFEIREIRALKLGGQGTDWALSHPMWGTWVEPITCLLKQMGKGSRIPYGVRGLKETIKSKQKEVTKLVTSFLLSTCKTQHYPILFP